MSDDKKETEKPAADNSLKQKKEQIRTDKVPSSNKQESENPSDKLPGGGLYS